MFGRAIAVTATGTPFTGSGEFVIHGIELVAGAATATLVVREVDGSGAILANLSAVANTFVATPIPRACKGAVHCTIGGAGAHATIIL